MTFWHYLLNVKNIITQIHMSVYTQQELVVINQYFEDFLHERARDGVRPKLSQSGWYLCLEIAHWLTDCSLRGRRCRDDAFE